MRNACRSSSPSSTLPRIASTRVTCAVRPAGTVRPGAHEANCGVLARRVLGQPRASAADGDDVTGEFGLVASRARFQVAKLLHALETVVPAEEGDNGTLSLNAQLLQHLWRDRLTQDHAVEPRSHPGGRAAAWRTGHEAERGKKSQRQHGVFCLKFSFSCKERGTPEVQSTQLQAYHCVHSSCPVFASQTGSDALERLL